MAPKKTKRTDPSISLRGLARLAGVSPATASLALRESPRLAEPTKARIRKLASEHGYSPNPRLSRLLSETVSVRYDKRGGLIYLIITRYTRKTWNQHNPWFLAMSKRCRELGYALEPFWIFESGLSPSRANDIMYSRGVDGLIIHPPPYSMRAGDSLSLPIEWDKFCVVEIDDVITAPVLHHVRHDHISGIWLALQEMEALGYRRIGLCLPPDVDFATHHRWAAGYGYWADMRGLRGACRKPLPYNGDPRALSRWVRANKLDAVLGPSRETLAAMQEGGLKVPDEIAFAALDLEFSAVEAGKPGDPFVSQSIGASRTPPQSIEEIRLQAPMAGVIQCRLDQYILAADMLASLIARGAKGPPVLSSSWILAGKWQPGASCPRKPGGMPAPPPQEPTPLQRKLPMAYRKDNNAKPPARHKAAKAFSLVEVIMALGLVLFCMVGLLGLMSTGLISLRGAAGDSTSTAIAKKLVAETQQNALSEIVGATYTDRYFNAEGQEVPPSDPMALYTASATATYTSAANTLGKITISIQRHAEANPTTVWVSFVARN